MLESRASAVNTEGDATMRFMMMVESAEHAGPAPVRRSGGKPTVTDGPFIETKELIGGYPVYDLSAWRRSARPRRRSHPGARRSTRSSRARRSA
jgi:hypothetical protein